MLLLVFPYNTAYLVKHAAINPKPAPPETMRLIHPKTGFSNTRQSLRQTPTSRLASITPICSSCVQQALTKTAFTSGVVSPKKGKGEPTEAELEAMKKTKSVCAACLCLEPLVLQAVLEQRDQRRDASCHFGGLLALVASLGRHLAQRDARALAHLYGRVGADGGEKQRAGGDKGEEPMPDGDSAVNPSLESETKPLKNSPVVLSPF